MNKYAEYKDAYKGLIKEALIREFLGKHILPAFSKDKALAEGMRRFKEMGSDDVLAAASKGVEDLAGDFAKIKANKNVDPIAMEIYIIGSWVTHILKEEAEGILYL